MGICRRSLSSQNRNSHKNLAFHRRQIEKSFHLQPHEMQLTQELKANADRPHSALCEWTLKLLVTGTHFHRKTIFSEKSFLERAREQIKFANFLFNVGFGRVVSPNEIT